MCSLSSGRATTTLPPAALADTLATAVLVVAGMLPVVEEATALAAKAVVRAALAMVAKILEMVAEVLALAVQVLAPVVSAENELENVG